MFRQLIPAPDFRLLAPDLRRPPGKMVIIHRVIAREDFFRPQAQGGEIPFLRLAAHQRRIKQPHQPAFNLRTDPPRFGRAGMSLVHHYRADAQRLGRQQRRQGLLRRITRQETNLEL